MSDTRDKTATGEGSGFKQGLGLFDATMMVIGSMIGSGIFIVSADMARLVGSPGWLLFSWMLTGVLTLAAALSYGELAGLMPKAGGQYVYLREAFSPLWGFLYGWTLFLVIQTGTIAAVAVGFARYLGVLIPFISESNYLISPVHLSEGYALSLSTGQLVGVLLIFFLSWVNTRGLNWGRVVQNVFTSAKTVALVALIAVALGYGLVTGQLATHLTNFWQPSSVADVVPGMNATLPAGLMVALLVAQTGSMFSADAWNNITFASEEVKNPRRNLPLALALGTLGVTLLYCLTNLAYLGTLSINAIQQAPHDRVAVAALDVVFPGAGASLMAVAIVVSTFGCNNGLILAGARTYYAMARDGLFFSKIGKLNAASVPGAALMIQGVWASILVLPRTYNAETGTYGNLYGNLLDYVMSSTFVFYLLTIAAVFRLRRIKRDAPREYRVVGFPWVPALYMVGAGLILAALFVYRSATTWPGLVIVLLGVPVYLLKSRSDRA